MRLRALVGVCVVIEGLCWSAIGCSSGGPTPRDTSDDDNSTDTSGDDDTSNVDTPPSSAGGASAVSSGAGGAAAGAGGGSQTNTSGGGGAPQGGTGGTSGSAGSTGTYGSGGGDPGTGTTTAPHFTETTSRWGSSAAAGHTHGAAIDLDNDGYPDLVVSGGNDASGHYKAPAHLRIFMNRASGGHRTFVETTSSSVPDPNYQVDVVVAGDVNNDGKWDLFAGTANDPGATSADTYRTRILLNDGTGRFSVATTSDVTPGPNDHLPLRGATFTDVDRDGKLDVFVGFWSKIYGQPPAYQHQLYRGNGNGTFTTFTKDAGMMMAGDCCYDQGTNYRPIDGVTACDLNDDGAPEIIASVYMREWNLLYRNDGAGHFTEVGRQTGFALGTSGDTTNNGAPFLQGGYSFVTVCQDFDGDGKPDLYNANIRHGYDPASEQSQLIHSDGAAGELKFSRPGNSNTGLTWQHVVAGSGWNESGTMATNADFDNDGRQDLFVSGLDYAQMSALIWQQRPNHTFVLMSSAWNLNFMNWNGSAVADFDRDGDLDIISMANFQFFENNANNNGHWLEIRLAGDGTTANRFGIGSKVTVDTGGAPQVQELQGGFGAGQQSDTLFFGLGTIATVKELTVRWPNKDATVQKFENVGANRFVEIRQGDDQVHDVKL